MANNQNLLPPYKPGQSGNLKGKPKGTLSLTTLLKSAIEQDYTIIVNAKTGEKQTKKFHEWVNLGLLRKAVKGDVRAIEHIYERVDGKVKQELFGKFETDSLQRDALRAILESKIEKRLKKEKDA